MVARSAAEGAGNGFAERLGTTQRLSY